MDEGESTLKEILPWRVLVPLLVLLLFQFQSLIFSTWGLLIWETRVITLVNYVPVDPDHDTNWEVSATHSHDFVSVPSVHNAKPTSYAYGYR